jgi:hypothetical protein
VKSLVVSIVDVLGIFIPGFLLILGIILLPISLGHASSYKLAWQATPDALRTNLVGIGVLVAILAYAFGFVLRLCAISILQFLTKRWWASRLTKKAEVLNPILEECVNNQKLCEGLKDIYGNTSMGHVAGYAPYFNFAKRIIRNGNPQLWPDAERLEAELRFSAGLFIPFFVLMINGLFLIKHPPFGWILFVFATAGCIVLLITFPRRRIREILHVYIMAIITLSYKSENAQEKQAVKEFD